METLKSANMMKNRRLARHLGDAAWSGFVAKLAYKAESAGVHLVKLDQWFASSKTCHCCGHKMPEMPLKVREWTCPGCRADHDRDINAAINIQHKGITELMAAGHVVKAHGGLRKSGSAPVAAQEVGSLAACGGEQSPGSRLFLIHMAERTVGETVVTHALLQR